MLDFYLVRCCLFVFVLTRLQLLLSFIRTTRHQTFFLPTRVAVCTLETPSFHPYVAAGSSQSDGPLSRQRWNFSRPGLQNHVVNQLRILPTPPKLIPGPRRISAANGAWAKKKWTLVLAKNEGTAWKRSRSSLGD